MTETKMFRELKKKLKEYPIKILRIETGQGLPDLFYYSEQDRFHGWIELKHVPTFDTENVKPDWRPGQRNRCKALYKSGDQVWLLISSDDKKEAWFLDGHYLMQSYPGPVKGKYTWEEISGRILYDMLS